MFQSICPIQLTLGEIISWALKHCGIRHVTNLYDFYKWYGFYLPIYLQPSLLLFLHFIIYRFSFVMGRGRNWIISNSRGMFFHTDGGKTLRACDVMKARRCNVMMSDSIRFGIFSSNCVNNYKATSFW